jgi:L-lactate dehydrogenase complex protein LldG
MPSPKETIFMFTQFKAKAEAAGAEVHRFGRKAEALAFIEDFLKKEDTKDAPGSYALWAEGPILNGVDTKSLAKKIPGLKFEVTRPLAKEAKICVSQVDWGIANTGTVAVDSTAVELRLAAALPWIHIAILDSGAIVPDLGALLSRMHPSKNSYIALTTGPSRTADIERVLAIGVHGPERLVLVCIDGTEGKKS